MERHELSELIKNMPVNEEIIITTSALHFGLKKIKLLNEVIILFGGHGKISYWIWNEDKTELTIEGIENHLDKYKSKVFGSIWITLSECKILKIS